MPGIGEGLDATVESLKSVSPDMMGAEADRASAGAAGVIIEIGLLLDQADVCVRSPMIVLIANGLEANKAYATGGDSLSGALGPNVGAAPRTALQGYGVALRQTTEALPPVREKYNELQDRLLEAKKAAEALLELLGIERNKITDASDAHGKAITAVVDYKQSLGL